MGNTSDIIWSICAVLVVLLLFVLWVRVSGRGDDLVGYITWGLGSVQRLKRQDEEREKEIERCRMREREKRERLHDREEEPKDLPRPRPLSEHLLQLQQGQMEYERERSRPPRTKQSGSRRAEGPNRSHREPSRGHGGRSRRSASNTVTVDGSQTLRDSPMPRSPPADVTAAPRQSRRQSTRQPVSSPPRSQQAVPIATEPQARPEIDAPFVPDQEHNPQFD